MRKTSATSAATGTRWCRYAYDDSVAIMEKLIAQGRDVTMLTNFAADTFAEARSNVSVPGETKRRHGFRRNPGHQAGACHLRSPRQGIRPRAAATIFIDDSQKNVDGAKAAGWQAVLFTDAPTLRRDLAARGIVV